MGIKDLNILLRRKCGVEYMSHTPICNFSGQKIAVDANLYACVFKRGSNNYTASIIEFLTLLRENMIHPFFVFDGEAPDEKHEERAARSEKRAAQRARIQNIKQDFETYKHTGVLSDLLKAIDFKTNRRLLSHIKVPNSTIQEYIDRLESQIVSITTEDFDTMKRILTLFGVPYVIAEGEGEFLCAALNRHGLVDAVFTADTDVLPCLAPTIINKIIESQFFQVVSLHDILTKLKLTEPQFIDLCILCGTDFNKNIPKIGPHGAYDLILRYASIDNLPPVYNTSILNHVRVRELFGFTEIRPTIDVPWCSKINFEGLGDYVADVTVIRRRINRHIVRKN